jgi:hypothetical protein
MGQDRQRLALAMFFRYAGERLWARRMVAKAQHRRVGEGPRERRMTDLHAGGALPLPRRGRGTLDQAVVGRKILPAGAALNGMDCLPPHQAQHRTAPRDGA